MNILVILAHPDQKSFNHSLAQTVVKKLRRRGHRTIFRDLYSEKYDPLITADELGREKPKKELGKYIRDLKKADGIIIIHPNWWGQPPAILKGWIDRVFRPGIAYKFEEQDEGEGVPAGLLKAGTALVFNTSDTPGDREKRVFGDPLETLWKNCVFGFCGVKRFYRKTFGVMVTSSLSERKKWLNEVEKITGKYFP